MFMKIRNLLCYLLIMLCFSSCLKAEGGNNESKGSKLLGNWKLISVKPEVNIDIRFNFKNNGILEIKTICKDPGFETKEDVVIGDYSVKQGDIHFLSEGGPGKVAKKIEGKHVITDDFKYFFDNENLVLESKQMGLTFKLEKIKNGPVN